MSTYSLEQFLDIKTSAKGSFHYDGTKISYLSDVSGTYQVYVKDLETDHIEQITSYENRIRFAAYIPFKNQILFGKDIGGNEQTQFFVYDEISKETTQITRDNNSIYRIGSTSRDGQKISYSSNQRNGKDFDVYVMDLETQEETCVYYNRGWCEALRFSADGTKIVVQDRESLVTNNLHIIEIETKESTQITEHNENSKYEQSEWLPDNSGFFCISNEESEFLCVDFYSLDTKKMTRVFQCEWDVFDIALSKDGTHLFVTINEGGYIKAKLFKVQNAEDSQEMLHEIHNIGMPSGMITGISWSEDSSKCLFTYGDANQIQSVWLWNKNTNTSSQVSTYFQTIDTKDLAIPELIEYTSHDGLVVPAFLFVPENIKESKKKSPVIILIHGGPESQYKPYFNPITQFLVHKGYAVAAPNVRGSSGYGKEYMTLDDQEKRLDSVEDIVFLKKYLETRDGIDAEKVIVMGGSYGGYMVLANMAFYPEHWLAGVDIVGMSNLVSFLENTSEWRRALREAEYGSLKHDREMLEKVSPINKVENIQAPLFIIHGANDPRVPLSEAEQMESKLQELGREVELLVYEDEGHGLSKLENKIDAYSKMVNFLGRQISKN